MKINILTRTHNRPNYFKRCRDSILMQNYKDITHIVSSDREEDEYIEADKIIQIGEREGQYPVNLYFNEMIKYVEDGWILHLDDDDQLTRPDSIQVMADHISSENDMLLWKVDFKPVIIPRHDFGKTPTIGNISGIGFLVHCKHWIDWLPVKCGDYHVIEQYYKKLNPVWIDDVLTGIQHKPGSIAKSWDFLMNKELKMDFVCPVNNEMLFRDNIEKSAIFNSHNFLVQRGFTNVPLAYNKAMELCDNQYICFVHQDVFFPNNWRRLFLKSLNEINKIDPHWGVLGVAGAKLINNRHVLKGHLKDRGGEWGTTKGLPEEVETLDELILIIKNDGALKFDELIPSNHFYGADICMQSRLQGRKCYAVEAYCHHNSTHDCHLPADFGVAAEYIKTKYREQLPIPTTCTILR